MSRLSLIVSLASLALFGGGASGILRSDVAASAGPAAEVPIPARLPTDPSFADQKGGAPERTVTWHQGASLTEALVHAGVGGLDAALADQLLASVEPGRSRTVKLWFGSPLPGGAKLLRKLEMVSSGRIITVVRHGEDLVAQQTVAPVNDTPMRIRVAGEQFAAELVASGIPAATRDDLLARMEGERPASVDLIIDHEEVAGDRRFGSPLYLALTLHSGMQRRWLADGDGGLRELSNGGADGLLRPVEGPVTSTVGLRFHPILRFLRWHRGTDFAAPTGTPVRAVLDGRVVQAGWSGGYGQVIRLQHGDGSTSAYAHLSQLAVSPGEQVRQGTVIGAVGESGLATGPHLHFEWLRGSTALKPSFEPANEGPHMIDGPTRAALASILTAAYRTPPVRS